MHDHHEDQAKRLIQASSSARPATEDFPELPLGSNAFLSPLHTISVRPAASDAPHRNRLSVVVLTTLASAAVVLTFAFVRGFASEHPPAAERARTIPQTAQRTPEPRPALTIHSTAALLRPPPSARDENGVPARNASAIPNRSALVNPRDKPNEPSSAKRSPATSDRARRATPRKRRAKPAPVVAPEVPSRAKVLAAMRGVTKEAQACLEGSGAIAQVDITFDGKTGSVASANVRGVSGRPGSCIAQAVRRAKVQPFRKAQLDITFPFRASR